MKEALEWRWLRQFPAWVLVLAAWIAVAPAWAAAEFLEPEKAFRLAVQEQGAGQVQLQWTIAPGYYLYRNRIGVSGTGVGAVEKPRGEVKEDPNFGTVEVYHEAVQVGVQAGTASTLRVTWQGCADEGLCYPPVEKDIVLASTGPSAAAPSAPVPAASTTGASTAAIVAGNDADISRLLSQRSLAWTLPLFFVLGIGLAFTPCVLPMVPILSSMVVGSGATPRRGLLLSLAFVGPMAAVYAGMGVLAALAGAGLQAWMQNPWTLLSFAAVFVVLALAMFGFYELQLPTALQSKLSEESGHLQGGRGIGVFAMGALSALIVGPCVAAPLAGALLYIGQTGDAVLGGTALFVMALGMGAPLVAVGVLARSALPRPGPWMEGVKKAFGVMLLAVAVWLVSPVLPGVVPMLAWAGLLVVSAIYLHALDPLPAHATGWQRFWKGWGVLALIAGAALFVGALAGSRDPLQPLAVLRAQAAAAPLAETRFQRVRSVDELDAVLKTAGRPVMLDFYADWCISCKEMERFTFADPAVARRLTGFLLIQADVTPNSDADKALLKRFGLFGPPGIIFFDAGGAERKQLRVVGFQEAGRFARVLDAATL